MFTALKTGSPLWVYLSKAQRSLARDGEFLIADSAHHTDEDPTDFSYLVFPFAKMYEGFLKQLFFDLEMITKEQYEGPLFRIGKALSPHMIRRLGDASVFKQLEHEYTRQFAVSLWETWKEGRNLVFHYFPHNIRSLTRDQAVGLVQRIIDAMDEAVKTTGVGKAMKFALASST